MATPDERLAELVELARDVLIQPQAASLAKRLAESVIEHAKPKPPKADRFSFKLEEPKEKTVSP